MVTERRRVDPIVVAVLSSRFNAINEEMGRVLIRTSRSPIFAEARDFGVAIFDKDLRLIAQKEYIAVLAGAIPVALQNIAAAYEGDINEGDIFIHNDCYAGNNHIPDMNIAKPVFYNGELMFWSVVKGHMADTGGRGVVGYDPNGTTIWDDGLTLPAAKLFDRGKLNRGIRDIIFRNVKLPDIVWGDILCEVGGVTVGERNFLALLDRYGFETIYGAIDEILAASEKEMRDKIRQMPDGVYHGEKSTDPVPAFGEEPVTARVKVTKKGDEITIDLSDSDPQTVGYLNSTWANTFSACQLVLAYALPGEVKRNQGSMVPVKIVARKGTWVNPEFPAPVTNCTTGASECIGEALLLALSEAIPQWIAASHAKMTNHMATGFNPRTKRQWVDIDFFTRMQPSGGTEGYDGWDLGGPTFELGGGRTPDLEIIELVKPVHILQCEQEPDTAGAGKFRSGIGHVYKVQYLADTDNGALICSGMRDYSPPSGLFGGKSPKPNTLVVHRADGQTEKQKVHTFLRLKAGDMMEEHMMGAGGFGAPFERDVEKVQQDVRNEVVSIEGARKDYGVVIDPVTQELNLKATEQLRKAHKKPLSNITTELT